MAYLKIASITYNCSLTFELLCICVKVEVDWIFESPDKNDGKRKKIVKLCKEYGG